jgi:hypothetical protein
MKKKHTIKIFPERWSIVHISVIALFLAVGISTFAIYYENEFLFTIFYYIVILPYGVGEVFLDLSPSDPQALPSYNAVFLILVAILAIVYYIICFTITALILLPKKYIPATFLVVYAIGSIIADYFFGHLF